jgi:hypothetical protein
MRKCQRKHAISSTIEREGLRRKFKLATISFLKRKEETKKSKTKINKKRKKPKPSEIYLRRSILLLALVFYYLDP